MKKYFIICGILSLVLIVAGVWYLTRPKNVTEGLSVAQKPTPAVVRDCTFNEQTMIGLMNGVRTNKLVLDTYLDSVAQKRADTIPYELDNHAGFRVLATNGTLVSYRGVNEILASNNVCASTDNIFTQWKLSSAHWGAITDERYDVLGIGFNGQSAVVIFGDLR